MDRFIAAQQIEQMTVSDYLKSNMDRFIDFVTKWIKNGSRNLKSNMDRFIESGCYVYLAIWSI